MTSARGQLQWGLLATSSMAGAMSHALRSTKRSVALAVASRDFARTRSVAAEEDIPRAYGSYEALLADPDIDVVYISLPNALHGQWVVAALEQGKHVLCEKPLVTTEADCDRVVKAEDNSGLIVTEAFMSLHHPQAAIVQSMLAGGRIGRPRFAQAWFGYTLPLSRTGDIRLST